MNAANAAPAAVPVSFEFFPPKTPEGIEKLRAVRQQLYALQPQFCSVTYGAGGSTQDGTLQAVQAILDEGQQGASHFTCVGASRDSVREKLALFQSMGVRRLVALRGDLPSGYGSMGEFRYAADLVAFIRAETGDHFHLEVAAYPEMHPQSRSAQADLQVYTYAAPYVQFCDQPGFGGNCIQISTSGNFQGTISAWNDNVQSVYVSGGASVALYTGSGFSGCVGVLTSSSSAAPFGRTDISSFRVGVTSCS